jgi:hypothetical protein
VEKQSRLSIQINWRWKRENEGHEASPRNEIIFYFHQSSDLHSIEEGIWTGFEKLKERGDC